VKTSAQGTSSSNLGVDAIAQAFEEIARTDISRSRAEDHELRDIQPARPARPSEASSERRLTAGKAAASTLVGFLAIACAGAIVFAWPTSGSRTAKSDPMPPAPAFVSVAPGEKQPLTTQVIPANAMAKIVKSIEQPAVQPQGRPSEPAVPVPPETMQRIQALEQRLMSLEQGIEQIKSDQARLARDNSHLLSELMEAQEKLALHLQEFASDAKAAEERAARDRLAAAEQVRGNQEQLAKIGEQLRTSQEQVDQIKAAAQRRATRIPPSPPQPPNIASPARPAPKPPSPHAAVSPAQNSRQPLIR
jgi:hypothetical protein